MAAKVSCIRVRQSGRTRPGQAAKAQVRVIVRVVSPVSGCYVFPGVCCFQTLWCQGLALPCGWEKTLFPTQLILGVPWGSFPLAPLLNFTQKSVC